MPLIIILKPPLLVKAGFIRKVSTYSCTVLLHVLLNITCNAFEITFSIALYECLSDGEGIKLENLEKEIVHDSEKLLFHLPLVFSPEHLQQRNN